jgi:uncharacterized protein
MLAQYFSPEYASMQWVIFAFCAFLTGSAKTGVPGVFIMVVPVMALSIGGKVSTGFLLPIMIMADFVALIYYRHHIYWKPVFKVLPWLMLGIGIGLWVGNNIDDRQFKIAMAVSVFACVGLILFENKVKVGQVLLESKSFYLVFGVIGGFATMIGNAAAPLIGVYLLMMKLPKNNYISIAAWIFAILNLIKFPLHYFIWETITPESLLTNIKLAPFILLGGICGFWLVKTIPSDRYRQLIIGVTIVSAFLLLI